MSERASGSGPAGFPAVSFVMPADTEEALGGQTIRRVLGAVGKFTKDGISCLIGKPATDEHVAIANDAITKNPTDGAKLAIAALLSAAHTCQ